MHICLTLILALTPLISVYFAALSLCNLGLDPGLGMSLDWGPLRCLGLGAGICGCWSVVHEASHIPQRAVGISGGGC